MLGVCVKGSGSSGIFWG